MAGGDHLTGMWMSFVLSALLITVFVQGMATALREREQRLKETMNIMGMRPVAYWLGWVLTAMAQLTLSAVGLTLSIHYGQIVLYSNPVILFIFIEVFTFATICSPGLNLFLFTIGS